MNSKKKLIIIGSIIILLLSGVLAFLLLNPVKDGDTDTSTSSQTSSEDEVDTSLPLVDRDIEELDSITFVNGDEQTKFELIAEDKWGIKELDGYLQLDCNADVSSLAGLHAKDIVTEKPDDLEQYGLKNPATKIVYDYSDEKVVVLVGDMTIDENSYYAQKEGEDKVYIVSTTTAKIAKRSSKDYLLKTLIPSFETEEGTELPKVTYFGFNRKDMEKPVVLTELTEEELAESGLQYASSFKMEKPVNAIVDYDFESNCVVPMFGLTADSIVSLDADKDEVKKQYGLDDPFATVKMVYDSITVELTFGDAVDSSNSAYYVTYNDDNVVYVVNASTIAALTVDPDDVISTILVLPIIYELEDIKLTLDDKDYDFKISLSEPEVTKDEDGNETVSKPSVTKVTCNGENIKVDSFQTFYLLLLLMSTDDINYSEPTTDECMTIKYNYLDKNKNSDVISIYDEGSRKMLIGLNGEVSFSGRTAYIDKVRLELEHLLNAEPVDSDW